MGRYGYAGNRGGPSGGGPSRGVGRHMGSAPAAAPSIIAHTGAATFQQDVLSSPLPVLVDVYTTWCGPCKAMAPHLEALAQELQGRLKVLKVDGDKDPAIVQGYGVRAYPTLLVFSGGSLVKSQAGSPGSVSAIRAFVEPHL